MITVNIKEEWIRLDSLLKLADMVSTGGHAKVVIQTGQVSVNGEVCLLRGKKMREGDTASFNGEQVTVGHGS